MRDVIDYMYAFGDDQGITVDWLDPDGAECFAYVEADPDEDLGVVLQPQRVTTCCNRCTFCFVDQMPRGMRSSLYVKDDDWRSSFLHGTYVTLTNLTEEDAKRIIGQHISPLYVSVHASDDDVRTRLMGTEKARGTFDLLRRLTGAGIDVQAQAVICGGVNDGDVLDRTLDDLFALHPHVRSVSVVPVGLTQFRDELHSVESISAENAKDIVERIEAHQKWYLSAAGTRFAFAADELYLKSGRPFPAYEAYEDFQQIENGVGLVAQFEHDARRELNRAKRAASRRVLLLSGADFAKRLELLRPRIENATGLSIVIEPVENTFFGPSVTVGGLLTGRDVLAAAAGRQGFDALFVPDIMFRDDGEKSLDDIPFSEIERAAGIPCFKASAQGDEFIRQLQACAA